MPAVRINNQAEYAKIIQVLDRVGGTWQGVNRDGLCLLVTPTQYRALVEAEVLPPQDANQDSSRGKKSRQAKP